MPRTTSNMVREPKYLRLAKVVDRMPKDASVRQIQAEFSNQYKGEQVASSYVSLVRNGLGRSGGGPVGEVKRGRRPNVKDCIYADDVRRVGKIASDCGGSTKLKKILSDIEICGGIRGVRRVLRMHDDMS